MMEGTRPLSWTCSSFPTFYYSGEHSLTITYRVLVTDPLTYLFGKRVFRCPYPQGQGPRMPYITRESYERILRGLTLQASPRIRWLVGTVTGLNLDPSNLEHISSVTVRKADNMEETIDASLVIGMCCRSSGYFSFSSYIRADCSGRTQAGFKWIKKLASIAAKTIPKYSSIKSEHLDSLRDEYDTVTPYTNFRFTIPEGLRNKLPIPGGFVNVGWIYANLPIPGKDAVYVIADRMEGHRCTCILKDVHSK